MGKPVLADLQFSGARLLGLPTPTASDEAAPKSYVDAAKLIEINDQTAAYTLVLGDAGKYVRMNVASPENLTVPLNSSVAFAVGTIIQVRQVGAGQITIVATGGVTINTPETLLLRKQGSAVSLIKVATDTWDLIGDLVLV